MRGKDLATIFFLGLVVLAMLACGDQRPVDIEKITSQPKQYVGSDTCKMCHLEHYDSWKMTLHSRMLQDAEKNQDAIIVPIDEKTIREDLAKIGDKLKVPADQIHVPKVEEIKYKIGSQWKQRFLVEKNGDLYIAPVQYNSETHRWVDYHENDWDKRSWLLKCGGCHATGVDLEKTSFVIESS